MKYILFIFSFLIISNNCLSQFLYKDRHTFSFELNEKQTPLAEGDSIIRELIRLSHNHNIRLGFERKNEEKKIFLEDLYPFVLKQIRDLVSRYYTDSLEEITPIERSKVAFIYKQIQEIQKQQQRNENKLKAVLELVNKLSNSPEKTWVKLKLDATNLHLSPLPNEVSTICFYAVRNTDSIADLYERGKAYIYIGDFAIKHYEPEIAIHMYYNANYYFSTISNDSILKYNAQALANEKIAHLFSFDFVQSVKKKIQYLELASIYYGKAHNREKAASTQSEFLSLYTHLYSDLRIYDADTLKRHQMQANLIKKFSLSISPYPNVDYFKSSSIASILRAEEKNSAALTYVLNELECAYSDLVKTGVEIGPIYEALYDAAYTYSKLKKEKHAMNLLNLATDLALKANDQASYYFSLFQKASCYEILHKYDSALFYINKVSNNVFFTSYYDFLDYKNSLMDIIHLKAIIFTNLNIKDSAILYFLNYDLLQKKNFEDFSKLLQYESNSFSNSLEVLKDKEIESEIDKKILIEKNSALQKAAAESRFTNTILISVISVLLLAILSVGGLIYYKIKNQREISALEAKALEDKIKRIEAENKQEKTESENIISQLQVQVQQGKNHEFVSLAGQNKDIVEATINDLESNPRLLNNEPKTILKGILYTANAIYNYAVKYHRSTENMITTVEKEIEMSRAYLEVFKVEQLLGNTITITDNIKGDFIKKQLKVPTHFLNNFIMNAIKHGTKKDITKKLLININSFKTEDGYIIEIEDDGCGVNYTKKNYPDAEQRVKGVSRAKKLIEYYNKRNLKYSIELPNNAIVDKSDIGLGDGTIVSIKFKLNDTKSFNS